MESSHERGGESMLELENFYHIVEIIYILCLIYKLCKDEEN